ncbi:branched-chain amino acid ABC transporter permease [Paraburkholderia sp. ZP32-5]|uniref:branched-chain amino acid ABC transporter permease n=1 Tax=Paraburkholderia sp. ZP32-5 TaxID=2883245 RepID=UPI001F1BA296|nr:branched-chain amino acid ABC transporter permease [Paraburkholderia sp. ZP32-5]
MAATLTFGLNLGYQLTVLAMLALGLAIVFGLLGVMNMAHGEFVMLGAYSVVLAQRWGLSPLAGVPLAIVVCAATGWIVERVLVRPLYRRPFDTLLATWGVSILLREAVRASFGAGYQNVAVPLSHAVTFAGVAYPAWRLVLMLVTAASLLAIGIGFTRSQVGACLRASIGNPDLARAIGIDTQRVATLTFIAGVVSAGIAGAMLAPLVTISPYMGLDYLLKGFFVLVVGGIGTIGGLLAGTAIIGGAQSGVASVLDQTAGYAAVLLLSILFLWMRPDGIVTRR